MSAEIPIMRAIFGMFTQFIYEHMTIYRNLTPNIIKDQKRAKIGSKRDKKKLKFKITHRNTIYACNFWPVYTIYKCAYDNLQEFDPQYSQRSKKGQKRVQIWK